MLYTVVGVRKYLMGLDEQAYEIVIKVIQVISLGVASKKMLLTFFFPFKS